VLPFDDPRAAEDLSRLSAGERYSAFHLVATSGAILSGEDAVLPTMDLLACGKHLAAMLRLVPGGERVVRSAYRWVARNRATLGRLFREGRSGSCDLGRDGG
jgi:predicted DCC family thiol-disulfide oxidoreductase YuxK